MAATEGIALDKVYSLYILPLPAPSRYDEVEQGVLITYRESNTTVLSRSLHALSTVSSVDGRQARYAGVGAGLDHHAEEESSPRWCFDRCSTSFLLAENLKTLPALPASPWLETGAASSTAGRWSTLRPLACLSQP